jgi:hypothetical protein
MKQRRKNSSHAAFVCLRSKKKAQNVGQIFVYILAIVIVGIILLFGYNAIRDMTKRMNDIGIVDFQKSLESDIKTTTSQYGTLLTKEYQLSNDYKEVCFVRNYFTSNTDSLEITQLDNHPLIKDSVESNTAKNTFLIQNNGQLAESFQMGTISLGDVDFKCFNVKNSRLTIRMEGKGNHIVIS